MNTLIQSHEFASWLAGLKDLGGRARIADRLVRAEGGNFGDCTPVGDGVSEMRIHHGPGYRVYFTRRGEVIYLLLIGGDKSTQAKDITRAKTMLRTLTQE
jgi:putative addiction module killer protein